MSSVYVTCITVWKTAKKWGTTGSPTELLRILDPLVLGEAKEQHHSRPGLCSLSIAAMPWQCRWDQPVPYVRVWYKGLWAEHYRISSNLHLLYLNLKILEALELCLQGGRTRIDLNNWEAPGHLIFPSTFLFVCFGKSEICNCFPVCILIVWQSEVKSWDVFILPSKGKSWIFSCYMLHLRVWVQWNL